MLARLEGQVILDVLLDRYSEIHLNPAVPLEFNQRNVVAVAIGPRTIPVVVGPT